MQQTEGPPLPLQSSGDCLRLNSMIKRPLSTDDPDKGLAATLTLDSL